MMDSSVEGITFTPNPLPSSSFNPFSPLTNAYKRFAKWRTDLGLPQPGTIENIQKEVKGRLLGRIQEKTLNLSFL